MNDRRRAFASLRLCVILIAAAVTTPASAELFKPEERFLGMLKDGNRVNAATVVNWYDAKVQPTLAGKAVFDAGNPFRWFIDQSVSLSSPPEASIEFFGGDCLPARVVDYETRKSDGFGNPVDLLIVEPLVSVDLPGRPVSAYLRVNPEWVKRIVFQRRTGGPGSYQPGTAFLHDGSHMRFRAARWSQGVVALLTEDGVKSLLLSQIAELHMPKRDGWEVWFEQLGVLMPDLVGRLIQMESSDGVRLTTSTQRFLPQFSGDKNKSENWYPLLQPAWSYDPITIPFKRVRCWRFFAPESLPLTTFEPDASRNGPVFSSGWNWRRDRGVQNSPLKNSGLAAGWGFGVHAPTELTLPLNPVATGLRCRTGLDQSIGQGGCVRTRVELTSAPGKPIWQSAVLIGPDSAVDTGWVNIPARPEEVAVTLIADPMSEGRPAGSDPFDIRDCVDWLEPEWRIDHAKLQQEVTVRLGERVPSLRGWTLTSTVPTFDDEVSAEATMPVLDVANFWNATVPTSPSYELTFGPASNFLTLSRKLKVGRNDRWLVVSIYRREADPVPTTVQIRVNGRALLQRDVPLMNSRLIPDPMLVPIDEFQDNRVQVDVIVMGKGEKPRLNWQGARLFKNPPGIVRLFDEEEEIIERLHNGEGELTLATESHYHGEKSLKLVAGDRLNANLPGVRFPIREFPQLGEFRYFTFAWKVAPEGEGAKRQGGLGLQIGHDGELGIRRQLNETKRRRAMPVPVLDRVRQAGPQRGKRRVYDNRGVRFGYQYLAGNVDEDELALRLDRNRPEKWVLLQRDLFAEFGDFDLTGLGLRLFAGEAAWFDQIYLYRTQADYAWIRELATEPVEYADENIVGEYSKVRNFGRLISAVAPQFSTTAAGEAIQLLKEYQGRKNVLRTMPVKQNTPCILRAPVTVPAGKKTLLRLSAAHHTEADWLLIVKVADKELYRSNVDATTAKEGWLDHEVDLSSFAGQTIVLEVHNQPTAWHYEHGYWSRLEVVSQ